MPHTLPLPELQASPAPGPTVEKNRSPANNAISPTTRSPARAPDSAKLQLTLGVSSLRSALGFSRSDQTKLSGLLGSDPTASCSPVENATVRLPMRSTEMTGALVTGCPERHV